MRAARLSLAPAVFVLAVACQSTASPGSSESPGIAPNVEPSSTPSPEQPIDVSPMIAPAAPSEAPDTPIQ